MKGPRIPNEDLLQAALTLMKSNDRPLRKIDGPGRAMLYALPGGETVRVRTCNDHILVVLASQHSGDARLNIEGTDWLLIVMPKTPRTPGALECYLVPTGVAVEAARATHQAWLESNPNTRGANTTWNLWFDDDGPAKANGFARKWSEYRLPGDAETGRVAVEGATGTPSDFRAEIEAARKRISTAAGVPLNAVKITVEFAS